MSAVVPRNPVPGETETSARIVATPADMKPEPIGGAIKRAADLYRKILKKPTDQRDALDRLAPDLSGDGVKSADIVLEALTEA